MNVTTLNENDLSLGLDLIKKSFIKFESPNLSQEGINEFQKFISETSIKQKLQTKELELFCYQSNSEIIGILGLKNNSHISLLFIKESFTKQGIGTKLVKFAKYNCQKNKIKTLTVNSSVYGKKFYENLGFKSQDNEKCFNGLKFTPMIIIF
ncbi:MAG: GNAT family N-acetyltransferase [Cetobacterium sp.]|nr:GNAT family N-acetyltransferase [Cetobacterium sp.]